MNRKSPYDGACFILTTKHAKSIALTSPIWNILGASLIEYQLDTDQLGTFSGEVERACSPTECARRKSQWAIDRLGDQVQFALASEGSFGPHPMIPFVPCDQELLYLIDQKHGFELHVSMTSTETNYRKEYIDSLEKLADFAEKTLFPSHGLILRSHSSSIGSNLHKGIIDPSSLEAIFIQLKNESDEGKVWVETDMRAQFNPSRMKVIRQLGEKLATRLASVCPDCGSPGWGCIQSVSGLPCESCGFETEMIGSEIHGCTRCEYTQTKARSDGKTSAEQRFCGQCNP